MPPSLLILTGAKTHSGEKETVSLEVCLTCEFGRGLGAKGWTLSAIFTRGPSSKIQGGAVDLSRYFVILQCINMVSFINQQEEHTINREQNITTDQPCTRKTGTGWMEEQMMSAR